MHWLTKPGTSHPEMVRITTAGQQELRTIPGVRNCGSHIGQALLMDEVYGIYFGENWISVDPAVDYDETLAKIQETVDGYPGLYRDVQTYLKERIREVLTGSSHPIVDPHLWRRDGSPARQGGGGGGEAFGDRRPHGICTWNSWLTSPRFKSRSTWTRPRHMDSSRAMCAGRRPIMIAGEEVGDIHMANRTYDVNVWSTPETRNSLTDILRAC